MSYPDVLTEHDIRTDPYINGYYTVEFKDGSVYSGKLVNSKLHGYGELFDENNKQLYSGIWMNGKPIAIIPLPVLTHLEKDKYKINVNDTCQKLKFTYNLYENNNNENNNNNINNENNKLIDSFDLEYYVPFVSSYNLTYVIKKAISQTELSYENKKIHVEVNNTECDLESISDCLQIADDIDNISGYITNLDEECSGCQKFNRGWVCCGQFAPYLYTYFNLIFDDKYEKFIEPFNSQLTNQKQNKILDIATVFYKVFTGYGLDDPDYHTIINKIKHNYKVSIPNVNDDDSFWYKPYKSIYSESDFLDNTSYIINIIDGIHVYHYSFIHRCNNYIIIADSWSSGNIGKRFPITRIVSIEIFIKCLNKLNSTYDNRNIYGNEEAQDELLLYNFIMDALFLVPYYNKNIAKSKQTFNLNNVSELRIVNPDVIENIFEQLATHDAKPFKEYLMLGGFNKGFTKGNKRKSKKRKSNKLKKRKSNKSRKNKK
jgi:hypothetical protein